MSRQRMLKPEFFTDDKVGELTFGEMLLFQGLWGLADRKRLLLDSPGDLRMKLSVLMASPSAPTLNVNAALERLAELGLVVRYEVGGKRLLWVVHFEDHQHPHIHEQPSTLPPPPKQGKHGASTVQARAKHHASPSESESESESFFNGSSVCLEPSSTPPSPSPARGTRLTPSAKQPPTTSTERSVEGLSVLTVQPMGAVESGALPSTFEGKQSPKRKTPRAEVATNGPRRLEPVDFPTTQIEYDSEPF